MDTRIFDVLKMCFLSWICVYGFINLISELYYSIFSIFLLIFISLSILLFIFRASTPNKTVVDYIIGNDPVYDAVNSFMKVVAHRGAGLDAPENSLIAFRMCAEKGCAGLEFDVRLTADNVPIIFHDESLERITGSQSIIKKLTWKELSNVDISIKHPLKEKFRHTKIAKLDETILLCLRNKQKMFIDIKEHDTNIVQVILDLYEKYPDLESRAVCSSFYAHIIYLIRRKNPNIVCSLAWRPNFFSYQSYSASTGLGLPRTQNYFKHFILLFIDALYAWALPRIIYYLTGISFILLHKDVISGKEIQDWRAKGVRVLAWTVNHPVEKQHFSRILKITYLTDTLIGESTAHANNNARLT